MGTATAVANSSSRLLLALVLLSCFHCCYPTARHGRQHARPPPTAATIVVGSVVHSASQPAAAISGTPAAVSCHDGNGRTVFEKEAVTDRRGRFHVRLAHQEATGARLRSVTSCSVRLLPPQQPSSSTAPPCAAATTAASRGGLRPVAAAPAEPGRHGGGARVFSVGAFAVHALEEVCSEKGIFFPPIPLVPEPPNIGGVPIPPNPITPAPPSLVPPVFPTPSPPSVLPPLVPQPPPSSIIPPFLPPLVTPPPPPPPPQLLPPLFPGIPPSFASKNRQPGTS